jgi:site-specific recombinase XerD
MRDTPALDPWIEGYLGYLLEVRRQARRTVSDVRSTCKRAAEAFAATHPGVALWELEQVDYLGSLERERRLGRTAACRAKYLSHLRGLLDYTWRSARSDRNVLDGLELRDEGRRRVPRVLTLEEARRLVEACPQSSFEARQERLIVLLLYGCGLRTAELCALRAADVERERRELFVRKGKGERQRVVPIPDGVMTAVLAHLLERGGLRGPLLRSAVKQRPLRAGQVCQVVREAAARAGLPGGVTPRTLRHSFATHLMDQGVDLAVIASLMGHRSPSETGVYLHVLPERPREAVERLGAGPAADPRSSS